MIDSEKLDGESRMTAPLERRNLMKRFGLGATAAALAPVFAGGASVLAAPTIAEAAVTDVDILNFALNLEYLEAEFYLHAALGQTLPESDITGTGKLGSVTGGSQVAFTDRYLQEAAAEIARDEFAHVKFLRSALGSAAVARPAIDLKTSFTTLARAAGFIGPNEFFDPFRGEWAFLLGAYVFEDVGVTAYSGAAPLITSKAYLAAAAGILAVEAYHAGEIRTRISAKAKYAASAAGISAVRAAASGAADDQGPLLDGVVNIIPTDSNGLAFARTTTQVLNIVYLGGAAANFGFFPDKLNGAIS